MTTEKVLTDDDFYAKYHPEYNKVLRRDNRPGIKTEDMCGYNGCMYETYGEEYEVVQEMVKKNPKRVWTIITVGEWEGICAGWHYINRTGYLITPEEWQDPNETYVSWDNSELHEQWEALPRNVVEEITGMSISEDMEEDEYEDFLADHFYTWEEMDELERDKFIAKYLNNGKEDEEEPPHHCGLDTTEC